MPHIVWNHTLNVKDIWRAEGVSFAQLQTMMAQRMRRLTPKLEEHVRDDWEDLAEQIESAEDYEEFDDVMVGVYDFADFERIWIATF